MNYSVDSLWFEFYKIIFLKKPNENYQELKKKISVFSEWARPGTASSPRLWGLRHMSLTLSFLVAPGNVYSRFHAQNWQMKGLPEHQKALH